MTYWDVTLAPLAEDGQVVGILNVTVDATERVAARRHLEQRVEERTRELEQRREIAESLRDIIGMINSHTPLETTLNRTVSMAAQRLGAAACTLHRFDMENQMLVQMASCGLEGIFPDQRKRPFDQLRSSGGEQYLRATLQRQATYQNYPPLPERLEEIRRDPTIPEAIKRERIALRQIRRLPLCAPFHPEQSLWGHGFLLHRAPRFFRRTSAARPNLCRTGRGSDRERASSPGDRTPP